MNAISPLPAFPATAEQRRDVRNNLFIAASLRWAGRTVAVRVRNMSQHGALVEAAVLPPLDTPLELTRGRLHASGQAVWSAGGRAGLRLSDSIFVKDWMAPVSHRAQQQVDSVVAAVRDGSAVAPWGGTPRLSPSPNEDLRSTVALLVRLSDRLAEDMDVVMRHSDRLQDLDLVQQMLEAIMDDRGERCARLGDLRRAISASLAG